MFQTTTHASSLVIFGASGSLARLKLFPAIYELAHEKRLTKDFCVVGYGRSEISDAKFREFFKKAVLEHVEIVDKKILEELLGKLTYVAGAYDDPKDYARLKAHLKAQEKGSKRVRMAYLSVPPTTFDAIFHGLAQGEFDTSLCKLRLIIEKPFGTDLRSALALQKKLKKLFKPEQIFLLDHYLGKEAVSNLLSLRYANSILTDLFTREFVSDIQISALETKDIEGRAHYFDEVGILRDMVQSHLLQILAYLTMFAPLKETAEAIHKEKARLLKTVHVDPKHVVRGQYADYAKEPGIPKGSMTETYAALKATLNHKVWKGVPIYIRSGKALKNKWTGVVIEFKDRAAQRRHGKLQQNRIVIQLQPTEKIEFHLYTKLGGKTFDFHELVTGRPIYCSGDCLTEHGRLLLDVIVGKQDLFLSFEEIFAAWKVMDPVQQVCDIMGKDNCKPAIYQRASLGPKAADELLERDGFKWFNPFQ